MGVHLFRGYDFYNLGYAKLRRFNKMNYAKQIEMGLITPEEGLRLATEDLSRLAQENLEHSSNLLGLFHQWEKVMREGANYKYNLTQEDFNEDN